jgi:hypothetical protein
VRGADGRIRGRGVDGTGIWRRTSRPCLPMRIRCTDAAGEG